MDLEKEYELLQKRANYALDILGDKKEPLLEAFMTKLYNIDIINTSSIELQNILGTMEKSLTQLEENLDKTLTPMDKVRIVRHPQRVCLKDILENVYDNYIEIGGRDEHNIDPGMLIARAYISRRVGKKIIQQPVMVVGQEKGHGEEFRNGGSIKPWGNDKALKYMKVADREGIPIHAYVGTPGSFPVEDYPGAAQQIAENIYEMAGLTVPIIAITSEGGSGGAEAIGLADKRLMLSHGYYSVISPEGAAAIEGRIKPGQRATPELIEMCAHHQQITADDHIRNGYIDKIITEPALGARPNHFSFFKHLRAEVIRATDEVVLSANSLRIFRKIAIKRHMKSIADAEDIIVRWQLGESSKKRLIFRRFKKYRRMAQHAYNDNRSLNEKMESAQSEFFANIHTTIQYGFIKKIQRKISNFSQEVSDDVQVVTSQFGKVKQAVATKIGASDGATYAAKNQLTQLSTCVTESFGDKEKYISPQACMDKEYSCPHSKRRGCLDIWGPDLFGEFAGVCPNCGHHFAMEYQWFHANIFDQNSIQEFNPSIASKNPCNFPNFDERLAAAKEKNKTQSGCMTFTAKIDNTRLTCATLIAPFRGGSVGAAEGEKFIRALELATSRKLPFIAYVHGTAGMRIQEGVNALIQMPRCTMAVRKYIEAGGLYIVLYDTNSYAGPVASFLGCSPYQFAVRSARVGFAGAGVINETTGMEIPPNYHSAYQALSRGHIQDIWDRKEIKFHLKRAFDTMGGSNLYYR